MLTITPLPQKKAALRSCPNMKVITDLATGGDSPRRWVMLALTPLANSHQSWGKVGLKESAHGSFKTTFFLFLLSFKNPPLTLTFLFLTPKSSSASQQTHPRTQKQMVSTQMRRSHARSCSKSNDCSEVSQTSRQTLVTHTHTHSLYDVKLIKR